MSYGMQTPLSNYPKSNSIYKRTPDGYGVCFFVALHTEKIRVQYIVYYCALAERVNI